MPHDDAETDERMPLTLLPADQILALLDEMQDTLDEIRIVVHRIGESEPALKGAAN